MKTILDGKIVDMDIEVSAKEIMADEIASCKALLAESDYKVTKNAECLALGLELPYNAEELHKERQAFRDRIKTLEKEL